MAVPIIVGAIVTGIVIGWWVTITAAAAAMSRSQTRMERKVRYWQAEASRAQAEAERVTRAALEQLVGPEKS